MRTVDKNACADIKLIETLEDKYGDQFDWPLDAIKFEEECLLADRKFLPECARRVLSGGPPTAAYWRWLINKAKERVD